MASHPADLLLSTRSGRIKNARRLARRAFRAEEGRFLAEGPQAVREALTIPEGVVEIFAAPDTATNHPDIYRLAQQQQVPWQLADQAALKALSDTVHPQGLVAVCATLDVALAELVAVRPRLLVLCADIRDPGNAGTVVRCADAAGADGVVLTGSSVDLYNGKAVRATAGSLFHVPVAVHHDTAEAMSILRADGMIVLATDGAGTLDLDDAIDEGVLQARTAWLFGNEAWGLPDSVGSLADRRVRVPLHGRAESLNLATAAAICLYASARAHRHRRALP